MGYLYNHWVVSGLIKKDNIINKIIDAETLLLDVKMGNNKSNDDYRNIIMLIIDVTFDII